jgi:phosphoheptose isomerase
VTVIVTATGNNPTYDHFYNVGVVAEGYVQGDKVCRAVNTSGYELSVTAAGTGYVNGGSTIVVSGLSHDYFYPLNSFTVNVTAIVTLV